jgi:hypothetical protein
MFGNQDNCRVENLVFEVVDLHSPYHALLGRPALAKFMASMHVAYLKMKIPGPKGVITIIGDYKRSMACDSNHSRGKEEAEASSGNCRSSGGRQIYVGHGEPKWHHLLLGGQRSEESGSG